MCFLVGDTPDRKGRVLNSGVPAKGNNRNNTCNGAYKGSLNVGAETRGDDDFEKNLQKMIPDGLIGRFLLDAPFNSPPNRLDDCETFVENTECQSTTGSS